MYIFKIKLEDYWKNSSHSYSFPTKSPKKRGTSGTPKYNHSKGGLGWFKCKSEKQAIKSFIHALRYNLNDLNSPFQKANPRTQNRPYTSCTVNGDTEKQEKNLKFLNDLMRETKFRYLDSYPEAFL